MRYYSSTAGEMTLQAGISPSDTVAIVNTTAGLPVQYPYTLLLDIGTASEEVVNVTAASGTTLTIERAQDGTAAQTHAFGAKVRHGMTARDLRESRQHEAATAAHGVGTVVGTTETQTLEGKTFQPSTDTNAAAFQARTGSTNPHTVVKDPAGNVVARWYEAVHELINGATVHAKLRFGGGPGLFKSILELRVGDDIHALVGSVVSGATGKFLRLMNGAAELFSVDAAGKVTAAGADFTTNVGVTGNVTATGTVSGATVSSTGAVSGATGVTAGSGADSTQRTVKVSRLNTTDSGAYDADLRVVAGATGSLGTVLTKGGVEQSRFELSSTGRAFTKDTVAGVTRNVPIIAAGEASSTHSSSSTGTVAVTFPAGLFTTAPKVVATSGNSGYFGFVSGTPTTSGATVGTVRRDGTSVSVSVPVTWIAVQE